MKLSASRFHHKSGVNARFQTDLKKGRLTSSHRFYKWKGAATGAFPFRYLLSVGLPAVSLFFVGLRRIFFNVFHILHASSLRYPSRFADDKREVKLVGEAFFSVAKDEKKFIVGTLNNSKIVVHGTEFNVEAYKGSRTVQTTLVSGKVSFSYVNNGRRNNVMMIPRQKVIYDIVREKVVVKEVNVDVETCWKDGRLIFRNTPFEDILKSLSKRYNVEFILKKASLKQNSFTATFTKQRLERILDHFRISSNIHFKFVEDGDVNAERQVIEVY